MKAVDGDRGINNKILYSISSGSQGIFDIDPNTGNIFTLKELDRESATSNNGAYILEIKVSTSLGECGVFIHSCIFVL